jgi:hypothetical protein
MAQHGARPGGEHGRHPAPVSAHEPVADGIDATVDAVKRPAREAMLDRSAAESEARELSARHDAVLALGELRDQRVGSRVRFPMYFMVDCTLEGRGAIVAIEALRIQTRTAPRLRPERHGMSVSC